MPCAAVWIGNMPGVGIGAILIQLHLVARFPRALVRHEGLSNSSIAFWKPAKPVGGSKPAASNGPMRHTCAGGHSHPQPPELVLETLRAAPNQLSEADATWVRWVPLEWYESYGPRAESFRLPKDKSKRDALAVQIGAAGYTLMDAIYSRDDAQHLRGLPDLEVLRCIWMQQYSRCTEPGMEEVRWRQNNEEPRQPCGFSRPMISMCATARSATRNG